MVSFFQGGQSLLVSVLRQERGRESACVCRTGMLVLIGQGSAVYAAV